MADPVDLSRHRHGMIAMHIAVILHRRPGKNITALTGRRWVIRRVEPGRRHRTVIDTAHPVFRRLVDQHEAAAARAAHPRFDHRNGEGCRNRRIHRVTARAQYIRPGFRRGPKMARNDSTAAANRRFTDLPVLIKIRVHSRKCRPRQQRWQGRRRLKLLSGSTPYIRLRRPNRESGG